MLPQINNSVLLKLAELMAEGAPGEDGKMPLVEDLQQVLAASWSGSAVRNVLRKITVAVSDETTRKSCLAFLLAIPNKNRDVPTGGNYAYTNDQLLAGLCLLPHPDGELYTLAKMSLGADAEVPTELFMHILFTIAPSRTWGAHLDKFILELSPSQ